MSPEALLAALRAGPTPVVVAGRGAATARLSANTLFLQEGPCAAAVRVTALRTVEAPLPGVQIVGSLDAMNVTTRKRAPSQHPLARRRWIFETKPNPAVVELFLHDPKLLPGERQRR